MTIQRILPYTKQLVLMALYDVLDQEKSEYHKDTGGDILALSLIHIYVHLECLRYAIFCP